MIINLKCLFPALLATATLAASAHAQTTVFLDTFDAAPTNGATRVLSMDLSGSATPGTFPSSRNDVFGIVDRNVNFDFADDTVINNADADPANDDNYGLVKPNKTDLFLGFEDTTNNDHPTGDVSVTWTVSTAGLTGLGLSFDVAAMGDFEATDTLTFKASFDGGTAETLFTSTFIDTPDTEVFNYTLDDGSLAVVPFNAPDTNVKDPFVIDGSTVINEFQNFNFPISGTGSELTLTLDYNTNGAGETLAIDDVQVTSGGGPSLTGDFDNDGDVDVDDIDAYTGNLNMAATGTLAQLDLNTDGQVTFDDLKIHVEQHVMTDLGTGTAIGDANLDGTVDVLSDAAAVINNLGLSVTSWSQGDFNKDGTVDVLGDAALLIDNLGFPNNAAAGVTTSAVPEPGSIALLTLGAIGTGLRRKRS